MFLQNLKVSGLHVKKNNDTEDDSQRYTEYRLMTAVSVPAFDYKINLQNGVSSMETGVFVIHCIVGPLEISKVALFQSFSLMSVEQNTKACNETYLRQDERNDYEARHRAPNRLIYVIVSASPLNARDAFILVLILGEQLDNLNRKLVDLTHSIPMDRFPSTACIFNDQNLFLILRTQRKKNTTVKYA